ncbi:MAG: DUF3795 domain-containing protein [Candidatus Bathyarchaeota archaeon]|nr:DUF3795 domain-containing protein [Candidatus Bathyarchaeum tardum]WGM88798.1 MAG: DUF3795 domain-containing protein [Candidatus Bathyarchaeum tardum]
MKPELVAPCGMDCNVCSGYLALEHKIRSKGIKMAYCKGCRPRDKQCAFLKKRCEKLLNHEIEFCYECQDFPCKNLQHIDDRYKSHYHMSLIENLQLIKEQSLEKFLETQQKKWECTECGGTICCHNGLCFNCGLEKLKQRKKIYRWED